MRSALVFVKHRFLTLPLLLCLPFLFLDNPAEHNRLLVELWHLGHIAYFLLAIVALRRQLDMRDWPHWLTVTIAVFLVSLIIEYMQYEVGLQQNWYTFWYNLYGAWLGIFWLNRPGPQVWTGRVVITGIVGFLIAQTVLVATREYRLSIRYPLLSSLEMAYEEDWWQGPAERTQDIAFHGQYSLRTRFSTDDHAAIQLTQLPKDWSEQRELHFQVYNPYITPVKLTLRLTDHAHQNNPYRSNDRFHHSFTADFGWNTVTVPLDAVRNAPANRLMELSDMAILEIFTTSLEEPRTLFFDAFWLNGQTPYSPQNPRQT